jgi:multimeric flavodoxin WrbA
MPKHLVISTSGNPDSNSRRMGRAAFAHLQKKEVDCDWIDIREMDLPLCDADKCYGMPGSKKLSATIESADGILIAAPVYNYDVAAATKNMIHIPCFRRRAHQRQKNRRANQTGRRRTRSLHQSASKLNSGLVSN